MSKVTAIHIGTSGWNYPHWRGKFYPAGLSDSKWFAQYAEVFDTVEINNTFYRLPEIQIVNRWRKQSPPGFICAVKASRFLTHRKKLKNVGRPLKQFLQRVRRLGQHLGPILYQLPPHWRPDVKRLRRFCAQLPSDVIHVMEFRERAWLNEEVYAVLKKHGVCLCLHDLLQRHPRRITGKIVYVRFHGVGSKYGGSYPRARLQRWGKWLRTTARNGHDVYAYFNNDAKGHAVRNALTLRKILNPG